jgi:hypothetical protein
VKLNGETTQEKLDDHCAIQRASRWDWKVKKSWKLKKGRHKMVLEGMLVWRNRAIWPCVH